MIFQWHISEKCNLSCTHCYQGELSKEPTLDELLYILDEIIKFSENKSKLHINITGGEPLLKKEFYDLIDVLNDKNISYGVLTNGTLIDKEKVKKLEKAKFIQVSIEGSEDTHNSIRGKNNYKKVLEGIRILKSHRKKVLVSFTAHKMNFREFPEVCNISRKSKVDKVWADRLIPSGKGSELETLNSEEFHEFLNIMAKEKKKKILFSKTEIAMERALQFLLGGEPYKCSAGKNLITIMPDGKIYPCRRMPIYCGNIFENSLDEIFELEALRNLREERADEKCDKCIYLKICNGGLKCLSYALTGNPIIRDVGCFLKK